MVAKLSRPASTGAAQNDSPAQDTQRVQPKGWGAKPVQTDIEDTAPAANSNQRERIAEQLSGGGQQAGVVDARSAFSRGVQDARGAVEGATGQDQTSNGVRMDQDEPKADPVPAATRRRRGAADTATVEARTNFDGIIASRAQLMAAIIASDPTATVEDLVGAADELWKWVAAA